MTDEYGWTIDMVAASTLEAPEMAPLRRWASTQLRDATRHRATVRLDRSALEPLAVLCGMDTVELAHRLPRPDPM